SKTISADSLPITNGSDNEILVGIKETKTYISNSPLSHDFFNKPSEEIPPTDTPPPPSNSNINKSIGLNLYMEYTSGQSHVIIYYLPELRILRFLEPIADDAETSTRKFLFFGSTSLLSPSTCHPSDLGAAGKICGGALLNMSMELHINYVTITNGQTIFPLRDAMNQLYRFGQMS
ncbi:12137_t:CDS:2, partial [Acaulospora morrowiae]